MSGIRLSAAGHPGEAAAPRRLPATMPPASRPPRSADPPAGQPNHPYAQGRKHLVRTIGWVPSHGGVGASGRAKRTTPRRRPTRCPA